MSLPATTASCRPAVAAALPGAAPALPRALLVTYTAPMGMRVRIDYEKCTGVAACEAVCPEVFVIRESDGLADVLEPEPHATLWECVRRAEEACPEEAIVIEEDEG